jgi:hypothetical protein
MKHSEKAIVHLEFRGIKNLLFRSPLSIIFAACGKPQQAAENKHPLVTVQTAQVVVKATPLNLESIGNVIAFNTVDVKSRVTGGLLKTFRFTRHHS